MSDDTSDIRYGPLPNYLRYWREKRRLSQTALGKMLKPRRSHSAISRMETRKIDLDLLPQLAAALDVHPKQLLFGPDVFATSLAPPGRAGFAEDASPWRGDIPGFRLDLGATETPYRVQTDVLSRARTRLLPGDLAVFDIGGATMDRFHAGEVPDATIVIAQAHDDETGAAATLVRQWLGDLPGLLVTNRAADNQILSLQQHGEITVMGVLTRSLRMHALPAPPRQLTER